MANFGIIRIQKLKTVASVRGSLKHALREQETPNADPHKLKDNHVYTGVNVAQSIEAFNQRLATQEKIRKNAVTCVEFLITASPEAMQSKTAREKKQYFDDAMKWIEEKHGNENIIHASIHNDEKTPHLSVFVVPIDQRGRLCCKSFYGGSKHVLSELQTEFTEKVAKNHELTRGIQGSKATHVNIHQYYRNINNKTFIQPYDVEANIIKTGLFKNEFESSNDIAKRINEKLESMNLLKMENTQLRKRVKSLEPYVQKVSMKELQLSPQEKQLFDEVKEKALTKILELKSSQKTKEIKKSFEFEKSNEPQKQNNHDNEPSFEL